MTPGVWFCGQFYKNLYIRPMARNIILFHNIVSVGNCFASFKTADLKINFGNTTGVKVEDCTSTFHIIGYLIHALKKGNRLPPIHLPVMVLGLGVQRRKRRC